jgi:hypothetical protein
VTTPKIDENRTLIGLTIEDIIFLEVWNQKNFW